VYLRNFYPGLLFNLANILIIIAGNCDDVGKFSSHSPQNSVAGDFGRETNVSKKKKRHTTAEIATKLAEAAALGSQGRTQREIAQALGVSVMTFHRWRKAQPQGLQARASAGSEPRRIVPIANLSESQRRGRIAELQLENTRLRRLVTDLLLEKMRIEDDAERYRGGPTLKKA
jgi:putative transposase